MSDTIPVRFVGMNHYHEGEALEEGDEIEIPERHYEKWSHKFVRLDSENGSDASEETSDETGIEASEDAPETDMGASDASEETDDSLATTNIEDSEDAPETDLGEVNAPDGVDEDEEVEPEGDKSEEDLAEALDGNLTDVQEELETGEYDDNLSELKVLENQGDDRKGVYNLIAEREE